MIHLNNTNKNGSSLKYNNSRIGLVEGFAGFLLLIGATIFFVVLGKIIKHAMWGHDSDNPAEEVPLQQEMMNMNGNIPNNQNNNIEIPLMAENGEAGL